MSSNAKFEGVRKYFEEHDAALLWVLEFQLSHEVLVLAVHDDDLPWRYDKVVCWGTISFRGEVKSTVYSRYEVDLIQHAKWGESVRIRGLDADFEVVCERVSVRTEVGEAQGEGAQSSSA